MNYSQLARIMRQATQQARLRTLNPLVGYVGAAVDIWRQHGLVTEEEVRAFRDALAAAGAELALAPQVVTVDPEVLAAKQRVGARQSTRHSDASGASGDAPQSQEALSRVRRTRGR